MDHEMYLVSEFQFLVPPFMLYRMHGIYGGLRAFLAEPGQTPHITTHGSMAAGDCSDAAVQGLCAGRGMVWKRGGGRAGARQGRTAQNSGRMFVFAATLVPRRRDIRHENVRERETLNPRNHRGASSTASVLAIVHFGSVGRLCGLSERSKAT